MRIVNFSNRQLILNGVPVMRSQMMPFWLQKNGSYVCTGYGRDGFVVAERRDAMRLRASGYKHIIITQDDNPEFHLTTEKSATDS